MGIDPEKLLMLFVIALIVLGPDRLPKLARSLGRGLAELRKYTSAVQHEVDNVLAEPRSLVRSALQEADLSGPLRYIDAPAQARAQTEQAVVATGALAQATGPGLAGPGAEMLPAHSGAEGGEANGAAALGPAGGDAGAVEALPDDPALN